MPDPRIGPNREALIAAFRSTAQWRAAKAQEFKDDAKSRAASERNQVALDEAARFIAGLSLSDPDLRWLKDVSSSSGRLYLCPESAELIRRFCTTTGAWAHRSARPAEQQIRKLLHRLSGAEARERAAERRDAS